MQYKKIQHACRFLYCSITRYCSFVRFGPYYIEPVIAGLDPKTFEPFICSLDLIGCPMETEDFVVSGTCSEQMYGMCESLWEPDMVRSTCLHSVTLDCVVFVTVEQKNNAITVSSYTDRFSPGTGGLV